MRVNPFAVALILIASVPPGAGAQTAAAPQTPAGQRAVGQPGTPAGQPAVQRPRGVQVLTLSSTAWSDGARIPSRHTQAGAEISPSLSWTSVPEGTTAFVLIVHDVDAATGNGTDDTLHWMLWNIPGTATSLPEGVPQGPQLPDGTRQISATGPYYRGPGAAAAGPAHHYVFELFALDAAIDVPAVGASPALTRAAVLTAMAGHVRGKGGYVGLFKR